MVNGSQRNYSCKDEELPVVCGFTLLSLKRDLADFTAYSPQFTGEYVTNYETRIADAQELVQPKSETVELKVITERIYATLDALIGPVNHLEGYINLAGKTVPLSAADFGLKQLRKSLRSRDVENVLAVLKTVEGNIARFKTELAAKGLTDELVAKFAAARTSLADDKNKKYGLLSARMARVVNNLGLLNSLYEQFTEICTIGKVLYKQTDKAKLNDYTFAWLMKQVRRSDKPAEEKPAEPANLETTGA